MICLSHIKKAYQPPAAVVVLKGCTHLEAALQLMSMLPCNKMNANDHKCT